MQNLIKLYQGWRQSEHTYTHTHTVTGHACTHTHTHRAGGSTTFTAQTHGMMVQPRPTWRSLRSGGPGGLGCAAPTVRGTHSTISAGLPSCDPQQSWRYTPSALPLWEPVHGSRSGGALDKIQFLEAWTFSTLSGRWHSRRRLHSFIKLWMPENQS